MLRNYKANIEINIENIETGKIIDLSQQKLTIEDYQWLAGVVKRASFVETLLLPKIESIDREKILAILEEVTRVNSTICDIKIDSKSINEPEQILSRLKRNQKKIFAIHGGGNIGLGLMADIVSKSALKYKIVATSNSKLRRDLVNANNELWIQHGRDHESTSCSIKNVTMISRDEGDIVKLYRDASLAAICVTPSVLPSISKNIAYALYLRYQADGCGLKILVLMNVPNNHQFVRDKVSTALLEITGNKLESDKILSGIEFIPTVIDRIVSTFDEKNILNHFRYQLLNKSMEDLTKCVGVDHQAVARNDDPLFVESVVNGIVSDPERLCHAVSTLKLKSILFDAEKVFSMHVPDSMCEANQFPGISTTKDIAQIDAVKNKYINGPHAILSWLGALIGCKTISEAINNQEIFRFIKEMMEEEIKPVLLAEFPNIRSEELNLLQSTFFDRCKASTHDSVVRVGRDPLRKLDKGGRVRGTIELAQKHKLNISLNRLEYGIASGLMYATSSIDPENPGCQKISEIVKENDGLFSSVLCYNGPAPSGKFTGMSLQKDGEVIQGILEKINIIKDHHLERMISMPTSKVKRAESNDQLSSKTVIKERTYQYSIFWKSKEGGKQVGNKESLNQNKI